MTFLTKNLVQAVFCEMLARENLGLKCMRAPTGSIVITAEKLREVFDRRFPDHQAPFFGVLTTPSDGVTMYIGPEMIDWAKRIALPKGHSNEHVFHRVSPHQRGLVSHATYAELTDWIRESIREKRGFEGPLKNKDVEALVLAFPQPKQNIAA